MRQLKKKIIRSAMSRESSRRIETRDAILWEIYTTERYCLVKIQGNNTTIKAYYPENIEQKPAWLKKGNAVKIQHTGGNRNRIEVVGHGQYVPTPTGASTFPDFAGSVDAVLSGCLLSGHGTSLAVSVSTGTYRIDGDIYSLNVMVMESGSAEVMGSTAVIMGGASAIVTLDGASSTLFRIDIIVVGVDGIVDLVKGSSSSSPVKPDVPAGHILLGTVLVPPDTISITNDLINVPFIEPFIASMQIIADPSELDWELNIETQLYEPELYSTITVSIKDQYNNTVTGTNFSIKGELLSVSGLLNGLYPTKTLGTGSDGVVQFIYERTEIETSGTSIMSFTLLDDPDITGMVPIILYDEPYIEE